MPHSPTPAPVPQALTITAHGRLNRILSEIAVCAAFDPAQPPPAQPNYTKAVALWDTGATNSVLSASLVKAMGLSPVGQANVHHGGGAGASPTYLVNVHLPHQVGFVGVLVTEFSDPADRSFNAIIGMDIIGVGDFAITNVGGQTVVSFRTPSMKSIDYVKEINAEQRASVPKVGRNDPCPCGSGKKYKKCHGVGV